MRRILPFIVVALGLAALAVDVLPNMARPFDPSGEIITTRLGLDLQGGLRGEYRAVPEDGQQIAPDILETVRSIIERRVNSTGVTEPLVQTQGTDRITVEIPGVTNAEQVRDLIGSTGRLDFVPIPPERNNEVVEGQRIPSDLPVLFSGDQIASAAPGIDPTTGERVVSFELHPEGARLFDELAARSQGERFAIVLDGVVQSAPSINAPRFGGRGQISGGFTAAEMNNLVTILKFGALPLAVEEVGFNRISATLGQTFLDQSIFAGAVGIGLVFLFMLLHYRLPGLVACIALLYYAVLVYAIFRLVPVTLTLAGVAGFVLSVGMAVDANILIFERTKEELRAGKTLFTAIEAGFNRAWTSIIDSNLATILTAGILYYFGSSTIRGFALVLIIGVLISMFTAVTLSRMMLRWIVRQGWARRASLYGVEEDEFTIAAPRARSREAGARV